MESLLLYRYGSSCAVSAGAIAGIIVGVLVNLVCCYFSGRIAEKKGYSFWAYFALTFFSAGIFGIIISCCLYDFVANKQVIVVKKWFCSKCGRSNSESHNYCSHCGEKRKDTQTKATNKKITTKQPMTPPSDKPWTCPECGYENNAKAMMCIECGKERQ